jgi:hypothetical protein
MYNYYLRRNALEEQEVRRNRKSTYNEPLQEAPDLEEFFIQFSNTIYTHERRLFYIQEQTKYPRLRSHFDMLVPAIVSYENFWLRYEYRTDIKRIMRQLRETNNQSWAESLGRSVGRMTQSFRKLMPEETDEAEDQKTVAVDDDPSASSDDPIKNAFTASLGRMRESIKTLVADEAAISESPRKDPLESVALPTPVLKHNISNQLSETEIGEKAPVEEGEEIFLTEDDYEEEQVISTEAEIGEEVMLQEPASYTQSEESLKMNIHIYPEGMNDEDRVEELEEHGNEDETESEEAHDVNGDSSVDDPVSNIYVYPEMIDVDNEAIQSNRVKEDAKIHDDEYGSIDDETKSDDEYGSLESVDPEMFVTEMDDQILTMNDTYYDDNLRKEENCQCACIIS